MSASHIPLRFVTLHTATIKGIGEVALRSLKLTKPKGIQSDWTQIAPISAVIPAPTDELVDHYIRWSGSDPAKYQGTIPPHLVSQWGLPFATQLLLQTTFPIANVINQGVTFRIRGDLPRHEPLRVGTSLHSVETHKGLARVTVRIVTGTVNSPDLVETDLHMAFILPGFEKSPKAQKPADTIQWQAVGTWSASSHDGFQFALLTGDFNPIHWIGIAGKLSNFGQKVLHGFGMLARTYERLPTAIHELDIRFVKPVKLPSPVLTVETGRDPETSQQRVRLRGPEQLIHLVGHFK